MSLSCSPAAHGPDTLGDSFVGEGVEEGLEGELEDGLSGLVVVEAGAGEVVVTTVPGAPIRTTGLSSNSFALMRSGSVSTATVV